MALGNRYGMARIAYYSRKALLSVGAVDTSLVGQSIFKVLTQIFTFF